jgi:hypothetical protein
VVTQHSRDELLLRSFIPYLGCGQYSKRSGKNSPAGDYLVTKLEDITEKIIPFFDKYPLQGTKSNDYIDFVKIMEIMKKKGHLTVEGLDQIKKIKAGMNQGRKFS